LSSFGRFLRRRPTNQPRGKDRPRALRRCEWPKHAELGDAWNVEHDATVLSIASSNPDGVFMIDELANAFAADTPEGVNPPHLRLGRTP
jgi:hypothetical protein